MAVAQAQRIRDLANGAAAEAGLVVEDVHLSPAGRRTVVRVTVDLPESQLGGVPVDAVAATSSALSRALDAEDVMGQSAYVLEVSSPGVDRPLTERRHWLRARGRLVAASLAGGGEVAGRLTVADDDGVVIADQHVPWNELGKGRVDVEFRHHDDEATDDEPVPDDGVEADEPADGLGEEWT
jgi:ribosome maturation factor RimP